MDEEAEEALKKERKRQLNMFAKENIWSEDDWGLLSRHFLEDNDDEILRWTHLYQRLNEYRESTKINSFWEPDRPSGDSVIRRYRSFDRFQTILENDALWFSRTDIFEDHFEGSFAYPNIERMERTTKRRRDRLGKHAAIPQNQVKQSNKERIENTNKRTYINCWRQGSDESAILWDAYIGDKFGVAIETTVGDFRKSISKEISDFRREAVRAKKKAFRKYAEIPPRERSKWERIEKLVTAVMAVEHSKLQVGLVNYIDFDDEVVPRSRYARFFHKRAGFEEEKEFRAVFEQPLTKLNSPTDPDKGKSIRVNIDKLIRKVVLMPDAPNWFKVRTETLLAQHGIEAKVERSDLDSERPSYGVMININSDEYGGPIIDFENPEARLDWDQNAMDDRQ